MRSEDRKIITTSLLEKQPIGLRIVEAVNRVNVAAEALDKMLAEIEAREDIDLSTVRLPSLVFLQRLNQ